MEWLRVLKCLEEKLYSAPANLVVGFVEEQLKNMSKKDKRRYLEFVSSKLMSLSTQQPEKETYQAFVKRVGGVDIVIK